MIPSFDLKAEMESVSHKIGGAQVVGITWETGYLIMEAGAFSKIPASKLKILQRKRGR